MRIKKNIELSEDAVINLTLQATQHQPRLLLKPYIEKLLEAISTMDKKEVEKLIKKTNKR